MISFGVFYYANPQLALGVEPSNPDEIFTPKVLVAFIVALVTGLWIAVAWHRFVLLEESPGAAFPPFRGSLMLSYFYRGFLIGLVVGFLGAILGLLLYFVWTFALGAFGVRPRAALVDFLMSLSVGIPMMALFYRISPILPAAALGDKMTFNEAMTATGSRMSTWLGLAAIMTVVSAILSLVALFLMGISLPVAIVWAVLQQWVMIMFNISILTTIYGHYIEGRELT